jgi:hypothetical protein
VSSLDTIANAPTRDADSENRAESRRSQLTSTDALRPKQAPLQHSSVTQANLARVCYVRPAMKAEAVAVIVSLKTIERMEDLKVVLEIARRASEHVRAPAVRLVGLGSAWGAAATEAMSGTDDAPYGGTPFELAPDGRDYNVEESTTAAILFRDLARERSARRIRRCVGAVDRSGVACHVIVLEYSGTSLGASQYESVLLCATPLDASLHRSERAQEVPSALGASARVILGLAAFVVVAAAYVAPGIVPAELPRWLGNVGRGFAALGATASAAFAITAPFRTRMPERTPAVVARRLLVLEEVIAASLSTPGRRLLASTLLVTLLLLLLGSAVRLQPASIIERALLAQATSRSVELAADLCVEQSDDWMASADFYVPPNSSCSGISALSATERTQLLVLAQPSAGKLVTLLALAETEAHERAAPSIFLVWHSCIRGDSPPATPSDVREALETCLVGQVRSVLAHHAHEATVAEEDILAYVRAGDYELFLEGADDSADPAGIDALFGVLMASRYLRLVVGARPETLRYLLVAHGITVPQVRDFVATAEPWIVPGGGARALLARAQERHGGAHAPEIAAALEEVDAALSGGAGRFAECAPVVDRIFSLPKLMVDMLSAVTPPALIDLSSIGGCSQLIEHYPAWLLAGHCHASELCDVPPSEQMRALTTATCSMDRPLLVEQVVARLAEIVGPEGHPRALVWELLGAGLLSSRNNGLQAGSNCPSTLVPGYYGGGVVPSVDGSVGARTD